MFRRLLPHTLLSRALLIVVTPLLLMQLLSAWVFYQSHWDQISKRLSLALAGEIVLLVDALAAIPDQASRAWLIEDAERRLDLQVSIEPGGILPNAPPTQTAIEGELRRALLSKQIGKPVRVDERSQPGSIVVSVQLPRGVLTAVAPSGRLSSWTTIAFVLWNAGMALILLGVATLFMRNQVRPVRRLARVADEFGKGRDVPDFRPEGAREVRQAAIAFIAMRNRIQRQITQRTAMLAGVSHDLRTPLTRMKLELEMMRPSAAVNELKEDIHEMERMLERLPRVRPRRRTGGDGTLRSRPPARRCGAPGAAPGRRGGSRLRGRPDAASPPARLPPLPEQPSRQRSALRPPRRGAGQAPRADDRGDRRRRRTGNPGGTA